MNVLHAGNSGDLISALPSIRELYRKTGEKQTLLLEKDRKAIYYEGAAHPVKNEEGEQVSLNQQMIDMLKPLLEAQEYIKEVKIWDGKEESVDVDLNLIRESFVNVPFGSLSRWYFQVYPDLACDLSKKWIEVPATDIDYAISKIIVTRTQRYLNPNIDYSFLKEQEQDIIFAGTAFEHQIFCTQFDLDIPRLSVTDFLQYAQAIQQCRFYLSNQTFGFQVAEGLKHPRIVELCNFAPNVTPIGEYAFDFYHQGALEYYVATLSGKSFGLSLM
jgi:hypothetical protein